MGNTIFFFLLMLMVSASYSQVGIGTINPTPASMLEVSSTSDAGQTYKGFMPPRVPTILERDAINPTVADAGLLVFVEETRCLQIWYGAGWDDVICTSSPIPVLASWDFEGNAGNESTVNAVIAPNIDNGIVSRGLGILPATNMNRFNADNFTQPNLTVAIANNDYFEFSITPSIGYQITINEIFFNYERSPTGPPLGTLRCSVDGYTTNLATFTNLLQTSDSRTIDLSSAGISNQTVTVTFRLYLYGNVGSQSGSGGFEGLGNDLEIRGYLN